MTQDLNPQAREMADESMVRNLAAQATCIWPQEEPLFRRYGLPDDVRILDAGCGTGEITGRLARLYPRSTVLGVDIVEDHLRLARSRLADLAPRLTFENRSVFDLGLPDHAFDLAVCRHVIQAIPHPERVLAELVRVTRPGGWLHVIAEDYGMIRFPVRTLDSDEFWHDGPRQFGRATGTDLRVGRSAHGLLRALGLRDITVDYVVVDPLRAPREAFANIFTAWRDGYVEPISRHTRFSADEARAHFDDMIATLHDPDGYGVWFVPVVAARVP
jgi:ubiquinone/menaquinone biosynthesis C-methylase UbiE